MLFHNRQAQGIVHKNSYRIWDCGCLVTGATATPLHPLLHNLFQIIDRNVALCQLPKILTWMTLSCKIKLCSTNCLIEITFPYHFHHKQLHIIVYALWQGMRSKKHWFALITLTDFSALLSVKIQWVGPPNQYYCNNEPSAASAAAGGNDEVEEGDRASLLNIENMMKIQSHMREVGAPIKPRLQEEITS